MKIQSNMTLNRYILLILFIVFIFTSSLSASTSRLAKYAGISQHSLNQIIKKLVRIESRTGRYDVINPTSGAYGRYQILPSTAKYYAKKLRIPQDSWKEPHNQDKIFHAILEDNIKNLKKYRHRVSAFSIYAMHQQGAEGFNSIMRNKPMSKRLERNLRHNLPTKYRNIPRHYLRYVWIRYWKKKLG